MVCYFTEDYIKWKKIFKNKIFKNNYWPPNFSVLMSRNDFQFTSKYLSFDNQDTRDNRCKNDRFAAFREVLEKFNAQFLNCSAINDYFLDAVHDQKSNFILLVQHWWACQVWFTFEINSPACYQYTLIATPYIGKQVEERGEFYLQGTDGVVKNLVQKVEEALSVKGRNVLLDHLYTSFSLVHWLSWKK